MLTKQQAQQGLSLTLQETNFVQWGTLHRGKVRDSYIGVSNDEDSLGQPQRIIVATDRLSAFDVQIGTVPFKGQMLNGMAAFWFEKSRMVVPNHLIAVPDPAVSLVHECRVIPIEMVVRGYLTGTSPTSIWTHYAAGGRNYCGHQLPEGMHKHEVLSKPLITPTTKAEMGAHDEPISASEIVSRGIASAELFEQMSAACLKLFEFGSEWAAQRQLILVDTKYEMGIAPDGELVFVDEIHTPDSSRYWYRDSYEAALRDGTDPRALDKDFVRRYLSDLGFNGNGPAPTLPDDVRCEAAVRYSEIFERVTGQSFVPDLRPPLARIQKQVAAFLKI